MDITVESNTGTSSESQVSKLASKVESRRTSYMANRIDLEHDLRLQQLVSQVSANIPHNPSAQEISAEVKKTYSQTLANLSSNPAEAEKIITDNNKPLTAKFISGEPQFLGDYFDNTKPANLCQQNVLLLAAVGAEKGIQINVAPIIFNRKSNGEKVTHVVGIYTDPQGIKYVLDPTLQGMDVSFIEKEKYLDLMDNPDLANEVTIFAPKK